MSLTPRRLVTIPTTVETSVDFTARAAAALSDAETRVYVDTSFLMWITKIGRVSRTQALDWVAAQCPGRLHVPIWSAHEYLKHHVSGTIANELEEKADELASVLGRAYSYFRPFLDEPLEPGAADPLAVRTAAIDAINTLANLVAVVRRWKRAYPKHAADVISFINAFSPSETGIFDHLSSISAEGPIRFSGALPPGFEDLRKGSGPAESSDQPGPPGTNRFGDLAFWLEVLEHAKGANAKRIVILTNHRKKDWYMGGGDLTGVAAELRALKQSWRPVPRTHPLLDAEARIRADIDEVVLLDSPYFAVLIRAHTTDDVEAFADVAIVPDPPKPKTPEEEKRAALVAFKAAEKAQTDEAAAAAERQGLFFADDPQLQISTLTLRRALLESRSPAHPDESEIIDRLRGGPEGRPSLQEVMTTTPFDGYNLNRLVRWAREIHDRALSGEAGLIESLADLAGGLERFPEKTASALFLGLIASAYLVRANNETRTPPRSPVLGQLLSLQARAFTGTVLQVISARLRDNERQPLYMPGPEENPIEAQFGISGAVNVLDEIASLRVGGLEVLVPAQQSAELNLSALYGTDQRIAGRELVRKACELYGAPLNQVIVTEDFEREFAITPTVGFKSPQLVFNIKDEVPDA